MGRVERAVPGRRNTVAADRERRGGMDSAKRADIDVRVSEGC
jgi:hypothetical protein